jgi:hypothetical protein
MSGEPRVSPAVNPLCGSIPKISSFKSSEEFNPRQPCSKRAHEHLNGAVETAEFLGTYRAFGARYSRLSYWQLARQTCPPQLLYCPNAGHSRFGPFLSLHLSLTTAAFVAVGLQPAGHRPPGHSPDLPGRRIEARGQRAGPRIVPGDLQRDHVRPARGSARPQQRADSDGGCQRLRGGACHLQPGFETRPSNLKPRLDSRFSVTYDQVSRSGCQLP